MKTRFANMRQLHSPSLSTLGLMALACAALLLAWCARSSVRERSEAASTDSASMHDAPAASSTSRVTSPPTSFPQFPAAVKLTFVAEGKAPKAVELCQFCVNSPQMYMGVDRCSPAPPCAEPRWEGARPIPWEQFGPGEYVGPARGAHVSEYPLRVDDQIDFIYRFTHEPIPHAYRLEVGDEIIVESFPQDHPDAIRRGDINLGRGMAVQPDGSITMPHVGRVPVAGRTIEEVEEDLTTRYSTLLKNNRFTVTPHKTNTKLEDLRSAIDARAGAGGQTRTATVTPNGTVQLVGISSVPAQGLSLDELQREINSRYAELVGRGVEVTAILRQRAPRFVWVVGEVNLPGQFPLNQPITVVQALGLARGFVNGGNVREIVVFRRDENWQLMATKLDVRGVYLGTTPYPSDNIWLRDDDIVVVPKMPIKRIDEFIELVFTRGLYGIVPFSGVSYGFFRQTAI